MAANKFLLIPEDIYMGLMECSKKEATVSPQPKKDKQIGIVSGMEDGEVNEAEDPGLAFSRMMLERAKKTKGADKAKKNILYNQALLNYRMMQTKREKQEAQEQLPANFQMYPDDRIEQAKMQRKWRHMPPIDWGHKRKPNKRPYKGGINLSAEKIKSHFSPKNRLKPALWK
jgi:hypothetical protein